jgi:hypothetical protein
MSYEPSTRYHVRLSPRFDVAKTDEEILRDEVFHRLTTDSVLGDTDEAKDWGFDCRRRLGARMTKDDVEALGPLLSAVLQRSGRIDSADVRVTQLDAPAPGMLSLQIAVSVTAVTGDTFSFLFRLTGSTFEQVGVTGST